MTTSGLKRYNEGVQKDIIDHGLPRNPPVPKDLKIALAGNSRAQVHFDAFAPSYRRSYIYWIEKAKRKRTREKRIAEVVARAEKNKKM
jgi:uncharacterized protein YdeI (YjbR/CyaY-like superfamily)